MAKVMKGTQTTKFMDIMTPTGHTSSTTASPAYLNTITHSGLKSSLMKMVEAVKEEKNKNLKKAKENTIKQIEGFTEETNKSLKVITETAFNQGSK